MAELPQILINTNGKSVVDYFICQHENLKLMYKCEVLLTTDLLHKFDLFNMLSPSCKAPDHSLLSIEFTPFNMDRLLNVNTTMVENENKNSKCQSSKIYYFNRPKPETWRNSILGIIESLQSRIACQEKLDILYNNICETLINEMDMYLESTL